MNINLEEVKFSYGNHENAEEGYCAMEWLSCVAGEPFSDNPPCMKGKGSLRAMAIRLNDLPGELRNSLEFKRAVYACLSADASPEAERARAFRAADWAVRECAPLAFDLTAKLFEVSGMASRADAMRLHASKMREQAPVRDEKSAAAARYAAARAADAASYAGAARAASYASYAADAAARAADAAHAASYAADAADAASRAANAARAASHAHAAGAADVELGNAIFHSTIKLFAELVSMKG